MYKITMKIRAENPAHSLSYIYVTYLSAQPQNKNYEFIVVEVLND